ncbi:thioredoxin domain-containing protein [Streptomyces sp. LX-29]|uniref:thioredoxin domain-containing protein n=1 Tax=Streptomyces sp. LX-29 TaxID=2900152 RepID=UPI00240E35F2|nr:thioredoxin domain-containing protein [Streptomyces sp. LX-29]WFB10043.1 thioredoxin domain-containing protein [Streptomyces sp. LX-29]
MSNRNSHANKQAARERMRAERERQAKKDKVRRQLTVAGAIVVVLAVAGGIGVAVSNMNKKSSTDSAWDKAKTAKFVKPANTTGKNGDIVIGKKDAKETLEVYEDPRCPACAGFEQSAGEQMLKDVEDGRYKVRYVLFNFIDSPDMAGGVGSKNAVSALGAALNVSPEAFIEYKKALFSKENHPSERDDAFADDDRLIEIAQQVKALKKNKAFDKDVRNGTYDRWALEMGELFGKNGVRGTPTFRHNGKILESSDQRSGGAILDLPSFVEVTDKQFPKK